MCFPSAILSCWCNNVVIQPCHAVDTAMMRILDHDASGGRSNVPNDEILIKRSWYHMRWIGRPCQAVHSRCMEHPSRHLRCFGGRVPNDNFAIGITRGNKLAARGISDACERASVSLKFLWLRQCVSTQRIYIDVIVRTADSDLLLIRRERDSSRTIWCCDRSNIRLPRRTWTLVLLDATTRDASLFAETPVPSPSNPILSGP